MPAKAPFPPKEYQTRAIENLRISYAKGHRRIVIVSPTGSGKTYMCSSIVASMLERSTTARVAWFAHRRELVSQAAESLSKWGVDVGHSGRNASARAQVVSVSGALSRGEVPPADLVILDECHHFAADEWGALPAAYGKDVTIIGATATPERADGRPLNHLFEHMVVVAQPAELVASGDLVPCTTYRPSRIQRKGKLAQLPVDAYVGAGLRGKKCVVFASNVSEAAEFLAQFKAKGIDGRVVHGKLPEATRDAYLSEFASGRVKVLVNVYVLTEGWDCPDVDVVIMARKCGSQSMMMQAVGRGLRRATGKTTCHFFDLCGITHLLGDPLEDKVFSLDGEGIKRKGAVAPERYCRVCKAILVEGEQCGCGADNELAIATASGDSLEKFARIRTDDDGQRSTRLAKWMTESVRRGNKWQASLYRYRGAYGGPPSSEIVSKAMALAGLKGGLKAS